MSSSTPLFSFDLYRKRLGRPQKRARPTWLDTLLTEELKLRLGCIQKTLQEPLILSDWPLSLSTPHQPLHNQTLLQTVLPDTTPLSHTCIVGTAEHLPFKKSTFDVIISLMQLHRMNDVVGFLAQCYQCLKPGGHFLAVFLGGNSFIQLRHALLQVEPTIRGGLSPRVAPMISLKDAAALLQQAHFTLPVADHFCVEKRYETFQEYLLEIQRLNLSNILTQQSKSLFTPHFLKQLTSYYTQCFQKDGKIFADFDLCFMSGWK